MTGYWTNDLYYAGGRQVVSTFHNVGQPDNGVTCDHPIDYVLPIPPPPKSEWKKDRPDWSPGQKYNL